MNYLEEAKKALVNEEEYYFNHGEHELADPETAIANALIAIAEAQAQLVKSDTAKILILDKIAEQLEKMNGNKGLCDSCQFPYQTCTCYDV